MKMKLSGRVTLLAVLQLPLILFVCVFPKCPSASAQSQQASDSGLSRLPLVQQTYYTAVTASFGNLLYSLHYEEYYANSIERLRTIGRYYQPNTIEFMDFKANAYVIFFTEPSQSTTYYYPIEQCFYYAPAVDSHSPLATRLINPSTWLLANMSQENVTFSKLGTTQVRSQCAAHFSVNSKFNSTNIFSATAASAAPALNQFLLIALNMSAVVNVSLANYSVDVNFDVYLASSCVDANLTSANGGAIPLRFTLSGTLTDATGAIHNIDILYDFALFTFLDAYNVQGLLPAADTWYCAPQTSGQIPPVPTAPRALLSTPQSLPLLSASERMALEFSVNDSNGFSVTAVRMLSNLLYGEDRIDFMVNPNKNIWNSLFYQYDTAEAENFIFTHGVMYSVQNSYYDSSNGRTCTGAVITPNNANPLQWDHAGSMETIFANPKFLTGASYIGRSTIRSIAVDEWSLRKGAAYNGVVYQFNINLYVTASGWLNLGRSNVSSSSPQLIRIAISGNSTSSSVVTPYSIQFDFYVQYGVSVDTISIYYFRPQIEGCPNVDSPGLQILPIMPPQYSVTVSAMNLWDMYSLQYTEYVDSVKSLRRIDGRFGGPKSITLMDGSGSPGNPSNGVLFEEWTQNVTLSAGFSQAQLYASLPYTAFQTNGAGSEVSCGSIVLSNSTLSFLSTANIFDLLALADQSTAYLQSTQIVRGTLVDTYAASMKLSEGGSVYALDFTIDYVSASITEEVIPLAILLQIIKRGASLQITNIQYNFFDFHPQLPENIFDSPPAITCTQNATFNSTLPATLTTASGPTILQFPSYGLQFSMLLELQLFLAQGDNTIYTVRWYADYANPAGPRERFDIQPSFSTNNYTQDDTDTHTAEALQEQLTLIYSYTPQPNGGIILENGTVHIFNSSGCTQQNITVSNMSPLTGVAPGNAFDAFMPLIFNQSNNQTIVSSAIYGGRIEILQNFPVWLDEFYWNTESNFDSSAYSAQTTIYVTVPKWINNPQSGGFSNTRIPMLMVTAGYFTAPGSNTQNAFSNTIYIASFQIGAPGSQLFDAPLAMSKQCRSPTTSPSLSISASQTVTTSALIGIIVGGGGLVLVIIAFAYCWRKRKNSDSDIGSNERKKKFHTFGGAVAGQSGRVDNNDETYNGGVAEMEMENVESKQQRIGIRNGNGNKNLHGQSVPGAEGSDGIEHVTSHLKQGKNGTVNATVSASLRLLKNVPNSSDFDELTGLADNTNTNAYINTTARAQDEAQGQAQTEAETDNVVVFYL